MLEGASSGATYSLFSICTVYTVLQARLDYYVSHRFEFVPKFQISKFNPYLASVTFIQKFIENQGLHKFNTKEVWASPSRSLVFSIPKATLGGVHLR